MNEKKITIRVSRILFRKIMAICKVTGKSKSVLFRDFILEEYEKNKKYEQQYYADLDENV